MLNLYPGYNPGFWSSDPNKRDDVRRTYPNNALQFLELELSKIGKQEPVIIFQHYGFVFTSESELNRHWTESQRNAFLRTIEDYNIVCIFYAHLHDIKYEWIKWTKTDGTKVEFLTVCTGGVSNYIKGFVRCRIETETVNKKNNGKFTMFFSQVNAGYGDCDLNHFTEKNNPLKQIQFEKKEPPSKEYVVDYCIVEHASDADQAREKCPKGYKLIDRDLNSGSGGYYIFLCYKMASSNTPIREMLMTRSGSKQTCKEGDTKIIETFPQDGKSSKEKLSFTCKMSHMPEKREADARYLADLNNGTGSRTKSIYLWSTTEGSAEPIKAIHVIGGRMKDLPSILSGTNMRCALQEGKDDPLNCNNTAKGQELYIVLEREKLHPISVRS